MAAKSPARMTHRATSAVARAVQFVMLVARFFAMVLAGT